MRKCTTAVLLIFVGAGLLTTGTAIAYTDFSGNNNCDQCHTQFDDFGSSHQSHTASYACSVCHVNNGDNPEVETCAVCHDSNLLWNYHLQFAPNDQFNMDCDTCHDVVGTDKDSWDGIKARYREALFSN